MAKTECPQCHNALQLPDDFAGKLVKCPLCHNTFTAPSESFATAPLLPKPPPLPTDIAQPKDDWEDADDEQRPVRRRRRFEDDDDYEDDLDIRHRGRMQPHRGATILTFGILSLLCCGIIFGPIAWIMGTNDLKSMAAGDMDRSGEGLTRAGQILGIVATVLSILGIGFYIIVGAGAAFGRR